MGDGKEKMFDYCTRSICCTTGFIKEILEAAQTSREKCDFHMSGNKFSIFPDGKIINGLGEHVKTVDLTGTIKNIE